MALCSLPLSSFPHQLSLDLDDGNTSQRQDCGVKRTVLFPKNIQIFNIPEFERKVSQLFDPLNINIEFRVTRHNRLEMRWSFPQEAVHYDQKKIVRERVQISAEENAALETLVISFARAGH